MKKERPFIRKFLKITLTFFSSLLFLLLSLFFILKSSRVQTWLTQKVSNYLSKEYGTTVSTGKVDLSLFRGLVLEDLFIADQQQDTLLFVRSVGVFPKGFPRSSSKLSFSNITADSLYVNLYQLSDSSLNMQFLLDSLSSGDESDEQSEFLLKIKNLALNDCRFNYRTLGTDTLPGINFGDIGLTHLNFNLKDFELHNNDILFSEAKLSAQDKSGFRISELHFTKTLLDAKGLKVDGLLLRTPQSFIGIHSVALLFHDFDDFSRFSDKVDIQLRISDSTRVTARDLNAFLPKPILGFDDIAMGGTWSGPLNRVFLQDFKLRVGNLLNMHMTAKVHHIMQFDSLAFDAEIENLRANLSQINQLRTHGGDSVLAELPKEVENLKQADFSGMATGDLNNYRSAGELSGPFGKMAYRITGGRDSLREHFVYGQIVAENVHLGEIVENKDLGRITMAQDIDVSLSRNNKLEFETTGVIDSAVFKGYRYRGISMYARLADSKIDSMMVSTKDENVDVLLFGSADFTNSIPDFNFSADVNHIDLYALNLYREKYPASMNFNLTADFRGDNPEDFVGQVYLTEPFHAELDTLSADFQQLKFTGEIASYHQGQMVKRYTVSSDPLDAEIMLTGDVNALIPALKKSLARYAPTLIDAPEDTNEDAYSHVNVTCNIKDASQVLQFVDTTMYLAPGTQITADYNSRADELDFSFHSAKFILSNIPIKNVALKAKNTDDEIDFTANFEEIDINDRFRLKHIRLLSKLYSDSLDFNLLWDNLSDTANTKADIKGILTFKENPADSSDYIEALLKQSDIYIEDKLWVTEQATIISDTSYIGIENLRFVHEEQSISINGSISHSPDSELAIDFSKFRLSNVNSLLPEGVALRGVMSGDFQFRELYSDFILMSNDTIENMYMNNINMGNMYLRSDWNSKMDDINFSFYNRFGDEALNQNVHVTDSVYGIYWPSNDSIALSGRFDGFNLRLFSPLYEDYINFVRGSQLTGTFNVWGLLKHPQVEANLSLKITSLGINYLETAYSVNTSLGLYIDNNIVRVDTTKLFSRGGGNALLFGEIKHQSFKNFIFDIALETDRFQFMNIQPTDTSYFYGTAYGSGLIYVRGNQDDIVLDIDIKTDKNTAFFIPLSTGETLSEAQGFMTFADDIPKDTADVDNEPGSADNTKPEQDEGGNMTINMSLAVTPGAQIQLIMDEQTGDIIKARGSGDLQIAITPDGGFRMLGDYTIEEGDYLFTLQNFFSKHFTIRQGGTIHWTGDPEQADIDLTAVYRLPKVGIYSLLLDPAIQGAKTPVECVIEMKGDLMTPAVQFGVEFPNDEYRVAQHFKVLEQDEINEQFLSLLLIGSFQPLPGLSQQASTGSPVKIGELVSNQLNRRLSDITKDVDLNMDYRTGNDLTTDELAVELSTRLLDDRITIATNVGVGGGLRESGGESPSENIVGEVEVNVKLNPKGTIQLKAYNKANDDYTYENGLYTQGVGFFWRKEFDKLKLFSKSKDESQDNLPDSIPPLPNDSAVTPKNDE